MPAAKSIDEYVALPTGGVEKIGASGTVPAGAVKFFAAYDEAGELVGIAAEGAAKGYADTVRILFGYDLATSSISASAWCPCARRRASATRS